MASPLSMVNHCSKCNDCYIASSDSSVMMSLCPLVEKQYCCSTRSKCRLGGRFWSIQ